MLHAVGAVVERRHILSYNICKNTKQNYHKLIITGHILSKVIYQSVIYYLFQWAQFRLTVNIKQPHSIDLLQCM